MAVNPTNISDGSISDDAQRQEPLAPLLGLLSREYTSDTDLSRRLGDLFHASAPTQLHTHTHCFPSLPPQLLPCDGLRHDPPTTPIAHASAAHPPPPNTARTSLR